MTPTTWFYIRVGPERARQKVSILGLTRPQFATLRALAGSRDFDYSLIPARDLASFPMPGPIVIRFRTRQGRECKRTIGLAG